MGKVSCCGGFALVNRRRSLALRYLSPNRRQTIKRCQPTMFVDGVWAAPQKDSQASHGLPKRAAIPPKSRRGSSPRDLEQTARGTWLTDMAQICIMVHMRTTLNIEPHLLKQAGKLTGVSEKTALVRMGLEALISRESAKRLAALGGTEKSLSVTPRRRLPKAS